MAYKRTLSLPFPEGDYNKDGNVSEDGVAGGDDDANHEADVRQPARHGENESPNRTSETNGSVADGDEADKFTKSAASMASSKGLVFLHVNARSLISKLEEIRKLLRDSKAAALAISESWLDDLVSSGEVSVDGYNFVRNDRNRHGGGVGLYIRQGISYNVRTDLMRPNLECIFVDILFPKSKLFLLGSCYRPPSDSSFIESFSNVLNTIPAGTEMYFLGDFNHCFSKNDGIVKTYKRMISSFSLEQLIKCATRVTANSRTVIDHVLTNCKSKIRESGVLDQVFSDHLITFCIKGKRKE